MFSTIEPVEEALPIVMAVWKVPNLSYPTHA